jgi:S-disulfanyl-L-cysteine oxidoreductase SoxD
LVPEQVVETPGAIGFWAGSGSFTSEPFEASGPIVVTLGAWCFEGIGFVSVMAIDADGEPVGEVLIIGEGVDSATFDVESGVYTLDVTVSHFHIYNWRVLVEDAEAAAGERSSSDAAIVGVADGAPAMPVSILDGVFSAAQAARGAAAYRVHCSGCHGDDLVSVDVYAPDLVGPAFASRWVDRTLAERLERIRTTMPLNRGGSLEDETYLDLIVFILQTNGYPSGEEELELDPDLLERIVVEPR